MTHTEELLALAEAATPGPWDTDSKDHDCPHQDIRIRYGEGRIKRTVCTVWIDDACYDENPQQERNAEYIAAANPETIKQLVELVRLQHEALLVHIALTRPIDTDTSRKAIEAFNKWERG